MILFREEETWLPLELSTVLDILNPHKFSLMLDDDELGFWGVFGSGINIKRIIKRKKMQTR